MLGSGVMGVSTINFQNLCSNFARRKSARMLAQNFKEWGIGHCSFVAEIFASQVFARWQNSRARLLRLRSVRPCEAPCFRFSPRLGPSACALAMRLPDRNRVPIRASHPRRVRFSRGTVSKNRHKAGFCLPVDIVSESWNQFHSWVFEASGAILAGR